MDNNKGGPPTYADVQQPAFQHNDAPPQQAYPTQQPFVPGQAYPQPVYVQQAYPQQAYPQQGYSQQGYNTQQVVVPLNGGVMLVSLH